MGSESKANEVKGWKGYWFRGHEGERNIVLVKSKYLVKKVPRQNILNQFKLGFNPFLLPKYYKYAGCFLVLVGYNI